MIPEIKNILYATDLSDSARYAYSYANDIAGKYDARITILYVVENINKTVEVQIRDMIGHAEWDRIKVEKQKEILKNIRKRVESFCIEMDEKDDQCRLAVEDVMIERGNPSEEILRVCKEIKADLIVMGSHGHSLLKDILIGSTARRVVKYSDKPVLTVKLPEA